MRNIFSGLTSFSLIWYQRKHFLPWLDPRPDLTPAFTPQRLRRLIFLPPPRICRWLLDDHHHHRPRVPALQLLDLESPIRPVFILRTILFLRPFILAVLPLQQQIAQLTRICRVPSSSVPVTTQVFFWFLLSSLDRTINLGSVLSPWLWQRRTSLGSSMVLSHGQILVMFFSILGLVAIIW